MTQLQYISYHKIDIGNRAFHRKSDQMIFIYIKSGYICMYICEESSLSLITNRLWQKQYVKTIHWRSSFTLKARQPERGSWRFTSDRRTSGTHQNPVWDWKVVSVVNQSMQSSNPTPLNDTKGTLNHMAHLMLYESPQWFSQNGS